MARQKIKPAVKRAPDESEAEHLKLSLKELKDRPIRTEVVMTNGSVNSPHSDLDGHIFALMNLFGSRSHDFMGVGLGSLETSSRTRGEERGQTVRCLNAGLALVQAVRPQNEIEAALAIQLSGVHSLACELLGRAKQTDRTDHIALYGGLAVKLSRTFVMQLEALAKLRGGGKQQVEVRHVYINGNAVIGDVHPGGGRNGGDQQQPHAPQPALTESATVWGQIETDGRAVSRAGNAGEKVLQDARRE